MKFLIPMILLFALMNTKLIFDFNSNSDIANWVIVDDVVMGGKSSGTFSLNSEGHGVFKGSISLENNGGFSSVRHQFLKIDVADNSKIQLNIKGDGKTYQIRIKTNSEDYYSYVSNFKTNGEWQIVDISLSDMYPSFRGRKLNKSNFKSDSIEEIAFLIGNKKRESFELLIDKIELN